MDDELAKAHRRAWEAIPWVVGGSASADDQQYLAAHLQGCPDCRDELAFQRQVREGLELAHPPAPNPEAALQRLRERIDRADSVAAALAEAPAAPDAPTRPLPAEPAIGSVAPAGSGWRSANGWMRTLAVAAVLQAVGLVAIATSVWGDAQRPADYETLSSTPAAPAPATIRFVPAPEMRMDALRQLLSRHRLMLVEASPDGLSFGLAANTGSAGPDERRLSALRAEPGVLLAEPIDARR